MAKRKQHNYRKKFEKLNSEGKVDRCPGAVRILEVRHDDSCAIWRGGVCDCDPDLELVTPNLKAMEAKHG